MKENEAKAVLFLGKYSQNKGLLDEVVKTLDFLDDLKKKEKDEQKERWERLVKEGLSKGLTEKKAVDYANNIFFSSYENINHEDYE